MVIMFVESCEVMICDDENLMCESFVVPRQCFAGEELEVERIDENEEMSHLVLADGCECDIPSNFFVRVS